MSAGEMRKTLRGGARKVMGGLSPDVVLRHEVGRGPEEALRTSVVIPTLRRPEFLRECVRSILEGCRKPDEIILVGREDDGETRTEVRRLQSRESPPPVIRDTWVREPGHIPPVRAGAQAASGDVVAFVDDDVTVTPEWLERIVRSFSDLRVGVVGGRVIVPGVPLARLKGRPGQLTWYGKLWGNIGSVEASAPFEVASVMEGNWVWRRELLLSLEFDPVLNFDDAAMYGLDWCLQAREKGFRVLYDSRAVVFHHAAPRVRELDRAERPRRFFSYCRNFTYVQLRHLPWWRRPLFLAWWFCVGENGAWGLASLVAAMRSPGQFARGEIPGVFAGKWEGIRLWLQSVRESSRPAPGV